jgi:hypothetical protein
MAELHRGEALRQQHHLRAAAAVPREKAESTQLLVTQRLRRHGSLALALPAGVPCSTSRRCLRASSFAIRDPDH